jgi:NitT/TauT family transport system permease protein
MPRRRICYAVLAVALWLALWQLAALWVGERLFLAAPADVLRTLWALLGSQDFYASMGFTLARVAAGFFGALVLGCALAVAAYRSEFFEALMRPFMGLAKSAPAASFTMIFLLMVGSLNMSVPVVLIMVTPLFYSNLLSGLKSVDSERFEAAEVFGMIPGDRFRFIYLPYVTPFFMSSCEVGWGMAWKAGVSAEVVAITANAVGGRIYNAKINLETAEIFAYTFAVIAAALALERGSVLLIRAVERRLTK